MANGIAKAHHYVPEWYQRRFLPDGKGNFLVLDKSPDRFISCPDGKRRPLRIKEVFPLGPNALFQKNELYSVNVPYLPRDFVETFVFGEIDTKGALANELYSSWPESRGGMFTDRSFEFPERYGDLSESMQALLQYMDAQKSRTPRGLQQMTNFLQYRGSNARQNDLISMLLKRRAVNCTVWSEGIWEIFSTESDDLRFLLSDDPVTLYNRDCYPMSKFCRFPNEPHPFWKGTRLIHPLSPHLLLVISHAEHVDNPDRKKSREFRTNARSFGDTIMHLLKIDHYRVLNFEQVHAINSVIKERAIRYIAATNKADLYPEKQTRLPKWSDIDEIFHPEFRSYHSSSEIVIGYKDGSVLSSDAFGRMQHVPAWFVRMNKAKKGIKD